MKKIQVFSASPYTSKAGRKSFKVTALSEEGVVVFFVPFEDNPKKGDVYSVDLVYSDYKMTFIPRFYKA